MALFDLVKRAALAVLGDSDAAEVKQLVVDGLNCLWTRDAQAQPAQSLALLDLSSTDITSLPTFRAIRFDSGGTFKVDLAGGASGITFNVASGEVWSMSNACFTKLYHTGTTATGIYGLV
jgi:hypothetical protein